MSAVLNPFIAMNTYKKLERKKKALQEITEKKTTFGNLIKIFKIFISVSVSFAYT